MISIRKIAISLLAYASLAASASAGPIVYVVNGSQQFGTVDLSTGKFQQIGPNAAEPGYFGLAPGPNGSLLTFAFSGNVYSINPANGVSTLLGPSGLGDCSTVASPCGPTSAGTLGEFGGTIYATDLQNDLYTVDRLTGAATLIGLTGIPAVPFVPGSQNADGTFNFYDQTIFGAGGKLYSTFDAFVFDFGTFTIVNSVIAPSLYEINPSTGSATLVGPTAWNLGAAFSLNGSSYAFDVSTNRIVSLNVTNGTTSFVGDVDPAAGVIGGAVVATPEPSALALAGIGMVAMVVSRLRGRRRARSTPRQKYAFALGIFLSAALNVFADGPTFTSIDYPGATSTQSWGISATGSIVGFYVSADKSTHGFLLAAGQYSSIDFPGAAFSEANGINSRGDIVGDYAFTLAGTGPHHGFLRSPDGTFTTIDFPGATSSFAGGINSRGDVLGSYTLADNINRSFLRSGGQFSTLELPGGVSIVANGINAQGDVVGGYSSGGVGHGLLFSDGDFTSFDLPGATFTTATGINPRGDTVGRYTSAGVNHGFLLSGGRFSTIDFPSAAYTGATAISTRGEILGRYRNADNVFHGFLMVGFEPACAVPMPPPKIAVTAGGPAVTHSSDFSLVGDSKPAAAGEVLSLFATDLGSTWPGVGAGQPFSSSPLNVVDSLVEVRVNGRSAIVLGAYGLPGTVDGYQVNFRLPTDTTKGSVAIELSAAGVAGAPVKIMVQ